MSIDMDNPRPECADYARLLEAATKERDALRAQLATVRAERDEAERRARNAEGVYTRDMAEMFKAREEVTTLRAKLQAAEERAESAGTALIAARSSGAADAVESIIEWLLAPCPCDEQDCEARYRAIATAIRRGDWRTPEGS